MVPTLRTQTFLARVLITCSIRDRGGVGWGGSIKYFSPSFIKISFKRAYFRINYRYLSAILHFCYVQKVKNPQPKKDWGRGEV